MSTSNHDGELEEWHETTGVRMNRAQIATQTEADLLLAIDHRDHDTRGVYADWLEEQGELERAEFVRLQDSLVGVAGFERRVVVERCREIGAAQDLAWRVLVARPPILNCWREPGCPRDWGSLAPTGLADVRYCTTCETWIHYCADERDRERYDERIEPFVMDVIIQLPGREPWPEHAIDPSAVSPEDPADGTTFDDSIPPWRR
jgi:uncharacterized protein (TIGR02996 family)